jgi:cell fate regulator YaaT (PSP1 superfamily)
MSKIGVKFMQGGKVFAVEDNIGLEVGHQVVVETIRGLEIGEVCKYTENSSSEEIKSLVRLATEEDLKKKAELEKNEEKVISTTNNLIKKYNLEMKLVDASFTLDGSKVIISYICEDRVDFRELVKDLASQLKLRIELRQIGIRDQAKIVGAIGNCGKECCCKMYLSDFDKVSIKMAKTQNLSLNPTKISGVCGRLMCCLSYENEYYSEMVSKMPKLNSKVKTKDGVGTVVYNDILKEKVNVKFVSEDSVKIVTYEIEEVKPYVEEQKNDSSQKKDKGNKK